MAAETTQVIRPAAVLPESAAVALQGALERMDVSRGGLWNVTTGLWQRYDRPWDGETGSMGTAHLIGTIAVAHGTPSKYDITIYRATVTAAGAELGWTVEGLCDDALQHAGLSLSLCPRADFHVPPVADPFRIRSLLT